MYIHIYIYYTHIYIYIHTLHVYITIYTNVCMYVCMSCHVMSCHVMSCHVMSCHVSMYVCMYVCVCVYIYIYVCVCASAFMVPYQMTSLFIILGSSSPQPAGRNAWKLVWLTRTSAIPSETRNFTGGFHDSAMVNTWKNPWKVWSSIPEWESKHIVCNVT